LSYLRSAIPEIKHQCSQYGIGVAFHFENHVMRSSFHKNKNNPNLQSGSISRKLKQCYYPWTRMHIDADGRVFPACQCSVHAGDLNKSSWKEIWNSKIMQSYRQFFCGQRVANICSEQCEVYHALGRIEIPQFYEDLASVK